MRTNLAVVQRMFETGLAVGRGLGRSGIRVLVLDSVRKIGFYSKYVKVTICPDPSQSEEKFIDFLLQVAEKGSNPVL